MNKIYRRFFLSFLIVLVLPVIFFAAFFMNNYKKVYRNKIIEREEIFVEKTIMELERNVDSMQSIVAYNSQLPYMQKYFVKNDIYGTEITTALSSEVITHAFLTDIHYYNPVKSERIYIKNGTYGMNYYAEYTGMGSAAVVKEYLQNRKIGEEFQRVDEESLLSGSSLRYVIKNTSGEVWIFYLSQEYLEEILNYADAKTMLIDENGVLLLEMANEGYQEGAYYEITAQSSEGNFMLIRQIGEDVLFRELENLQNRFLLMVLILLLFGGALIAVLTFYNEYPVKKMKFWYEEQFKLSEQKHRKNILLMQMVTGSGCNTERFRKAVTEAGLFKEAECYRVLIAVISQDAELELNRLKLYLTESVPGEVHLIDISSHKVAVILLGLSEEEDLTLEKSLQSVCGEIKKNAGKELVIYVGDKQKTYENIHLSYHEAVMGSRHEEDNEKLQVVYCKTAKKEQEEFLYPEMELNTLYEALVEADMDKADVITDALLLVLKEQNDNRVVHASLYYDIQNVYYRAQMKLKWNIKSVLLDTDILNKNVDVDEMKVIEQVRKQFRRYIEGSKEHEKEDNLITRVTHYIDENRTCSELCVSMVADHFEMSISNLSHQFKAQTCCTISDYIREKKFEYAGELLKQTDYSVQTIGTIIGYNQTANFIQKFKRYHGVTPAEYRKQEADEQKSLRADL